MDKYNKKIPRIQPPNNHKSELECELTNLMYVLSDSKEIGSNHFDEIIRLVLKQLVAFAEPPPDMWKRIEREAQ